MGGMLPWVLFLAGFLSGCMGAPEGSPEPSSTPDLDPPMSDRPMFQLQGCSEVILRLRVPREQAQALVPDAFVATGAIPGTATVLVFGLDCERALDNATLYGRHSQFLAIVFADPKNDSWTEPGYQSYYVLDFLVSPDGLSAMMNSLNVPSQSAAISIAKSPPVGDRSVWDWDAAGPNGSFRFAHTSKDSFTQSVNDTAHLWFGTREFVRVDTIVTHSLGELVTGATMVLDGESKLRTLLGAPSMAYEAQTAGNYESSVIVQEGVFVE